MPVSSRSTSNPCWRLTLARCCNGAAEWRADVHAFDFRVAFAIGRANELHAAARRRSFVEPADEERDAITQELLDAVAVAALLRVERLEQCVELGNEGGSIRRIRSFFFNDNGHDDSNSIKRRLAYTMTARHCGLVFWRAQP